MLSESGCEATRLEGPTPAKASGGAIELSEAIVARGADVVPRFRIRRNYMWSRGQCSHHVRDTTSIADRRHGLHRQAERSRPAN